MKIFWHFCIYWITISWQIYHNIFIKDVFSLFSSLFIILQASSYHQLLQNLHQQPEKQYLPLKSFNVWFVEICWKNRNWWMSVLVLNTLVVSYSVYFCCYFLQYLWCWVFHLSVRQLISCMCAQWSRCHTHGGRHLSICRMCIDSSVLNGFHP